MSIEDSARHPIVIWDWTTGSQLAHVQGHNDSVFAVAFNPITRHLVTGGK